MNNEAIDLSTAGITVNYAVEQTAGTRPTTGYTMIPGVKSTPNLNPAPETLESTTLDKTKYKTYVEGLKDLGGALELTANLTQLLLDRWEDIETAYQTNIISSKKMWFCIIFPGLDKAVFFPGKPGTMGAPETAVNSILETTLYITPTGEPDWFEKPSA